MRIGVLTSGGDCPGLNAVIRGAVLKGTKIHLSTEGEQAQEAMDALVDLIERYFDEGE